MPPSELDRLEFYFIEYMIQDLEEKFEAENKHYKKEKVAQEKSMAKQSSMPNLNYGGFKTPKIDMPKF